jgi:hypothetical protein
MEDELKKRSNPNYTTPNRKRKPKYVSSDIDRRMTESEKKNYIKRMNPRKKDIASKGKISKPSRSMMVDTTTSAYGDAGRGRPVPEFSHGGEAKVRGMGCAIKGGKFEGVF